ncbi:hypothetical protein ACFWXT_29375 [Bacillus cereus]|uniref:hypothetical protein n=1 Tax=Bacillus cereus TaxID=1396 RepID=UPI00366E28F4
MVVRLALWDVVVGSECRRRLEPFYKNEHQGDAASEIDRQLMSAVFWRKRVLLGNDHEDQHWALMRLREARARMN